MLLFLTSFQPFIRPNRAPISLFLPMMLFPYVTNGKDIFAMALSPVAAAWYRPGDMIILPGKADSIDAGAAYNST